MIKNILKKFGYVKRDDFVQQLHYARSVNKRLDEHRETVEDLERFGFLTDDFFWRINHLATQDDYLMRLYFMVYGCYPENQLGQRSSVRSRPLILGNCELPEYEKNKEIKY